MGYLLQILLAVGVLGVVEEGVTTGWTLPLVMPFLAIVPLLLGRMARKEHLKGRFKRGALFSGLTSASPPALFLFVLSVCGWNESVATWLDTTPSLFTWPDFSILTVLFPFVLYQAAAIDAKSRLQSATEIGRKNLRNLQLRMFLASLAPILLYILLAATVGEFDALRISIEEVGLWGALFGGVAVFLLALFLPTVVRNTWETEPVPEGVERKLLTEVAKRASFDCKEILVWRTGNLMANAAIIGLTARHRVVLFSDALIAQLQLRELASVFAHEIGHAAKRHVLIFASWAIAFFLAVDLLATELEIESLGAATGLLAAALIFGYFAFGYLSRRFELDADLYAIELLGDHEGMIQALESVGGHLRDVAGWRHFSTKDRVRFLDAAREDPGVASALRRKLRGFTVLGVALLVVLSALELRSLARTFPEDNVYVDLRLGRYEEVAELDDSPDFDPRTQALIERTRSLLYEEGGREGDLTPALFARRARAALREGQGPEALAYFELGILAGAEELRPPGIAVELALQGEREEALQWLDEAEDAWRKELRPWIEALVIESDS